jgi:hypothetical protein
MFAYLITECVASKGSHPIPVPVILPHMAILTFVSGIRRT